MFESSDYADTIRFNIPNGWTIAQMRDCFDKCLAIAKEYDRMVVMPVQAPVHPRILGLMEQMEAFEHVGSMGVTSFKRHQEPPAVEVDDRRTNG